MAKPIAAVAWNLESKGSGTAPDPKIGVVRESLGSGRYVVLLGTDKTLVQSGVDLKAGDIVRVFDKLPESVQTERLSGSSRVSEAGPGLPWRAFIPLAFGGEKASGDLRVYIEKVTNARVNPDGPAAYFVFTVTTEIQGELQWSVYLKKRNVAIQVFDADGKIGKGRLAELIATIENGLKQSGFNFLAPTSVLKRSFKVPKGFRLDVEG